MMRLDRYIGDEPKFKVLRRQSDGNYREVPAFDYFVLALKDLNTSAALVGYAEAAASRGDAELAEDVLRMREESFFLPGRKVPD